MSVPALAVRELQKTYAGGATALQGVSLEVREGDFFALLGPNGAGKSTLIGITTTLVNPSGGCVEVFGHCVQRRREAALALLGVVPQEFNFNQFETPLEIVVNQAGFHGIPGKLARERAEKYLRELQLWGKHDKPSRTLSGGMKRRLMIARAMVNEPRLLILDEPTAGVDVEIRRSMWKFISAINAAGTTVILTTHYLEEVEQLCRNVAIIDHGRIVENTSVKQLIAKLDVETFLFDAAAELPKVLPVVAGVELARLDATTVRATMGRDHDLNSVFAAFDAAGITVASMRNQANRLEELFLRLVNSKKAA